MSKPLSTKNSIWLILALIIVGYGASKYLPEPKSLQIAPSTVERLFQQHRSGVQLGADGTVSKLLADDLAGTRHQKFILTLASGQTVLIAHNIDVAPKIDSLRQGDHVSVYGQYEWNEQGGVIHWTHEDPRHPNGWVKHQGQVYQ